jgi:DNA-binding transcriptional ArsR family regulator
MATNTHLADGEAAARVLRVLETEGRKFSWLAEASGIARSTLRHQLKVKPEALTVKNFLRIAAALDRPVEALIGERAA